MAASLSEKELIDALTSYGNYDVVPKSSTPGKEAKSRMAAHFPPPIETTHIHNTSPSIPKIPFFSGDSPPQKGDITYNEWRFEISCLISDSEMLPSVILQALRRSLRGTARKMLIPLGEKATVKDILTKLDSLFGDVTTKGMVMQEFFNCVQGADESVTAFGCRLESLLQTAIDSGNLSQEAKNDLLRHKFWTSLQSERLKSQTRHKYDTIKNYDDLLREIRMVEKEISIGTITNKSKPHQHPVYASHEQELSTLEDKMNSKIQSLESRLETKLDEKFNLVLERLNSIDVNGCNQSTTSGTGYDQSGSNKGRGQSYHYRSSGNSGNRSRGRSHGNGRYNNNTSYNNQGNRQHPKV